jgi:hypothetical protein
MLRSATRLWCMQAAELVSGMDWLKQSKAYQGRRNAGAPGGFQLLFARDHTRRSYRRHNSP